MKNPKLNNAIKDLFVLEIFLSKLKSLPHFTYGEDFDINFFSRKLSRGVKNYNLSDLTLEEYVDILQRKEFMTVLLKKYNIRFVSKNTIYILYIYWKERLNGIDNLFKKYVQFSIEEAKRSKSTGVDLSQINKKYSFLPEEFTLLYTIFSEAGISWKDIPTTPVSEAFLLLLERQKDETSKAIAQDYYINKKK